MGMISCKDCGTVLTDYTRRRCNDCGADLCLNCFRLRYELCIACENEEFWPRDEDDFDVDWEE